MGMEMTLCSTCPSVYLVWASGRHLLSYFHTVSEQRPGYCRGWGFHARTRGSGDAALKGWDQHPKQTSLWITIDLGSRALCLCGST